MTRPRRFASPATTRRVKPIAAVLIFTLGCLAFALLVWAVAAMFLRPPHYAEGCLLFNASRIRDGLPLYVPAIVGAHEYGEPPARYWVAYTPLYTAILSALPAAHALLIARTLGLFAWYGAIGRCVIAAPTANRGRTAVAALFVASVYHFTSEGVSAKPDALALLLASIALARALRLGRADARVGLLFVLAALLKPSVFGAGLGVLAASALIERRVRSVLIAGAALALGLATLQWMSGGAALTHMRSALALKFELHRAALAIPTRFPFVAGLIVAAAVGAWQSRRDVAARIGLAALASSVVIASIGLGKLGAATNYLMEPSLVSLVLLSRFSPVPPRRAVPMIALASVLLLTLIWSTNATVRSLSRQAFELGSASRALERIRGRCLDRPGALVVSSDPGTELVVNGRLHSHMIELWSETAAGRFPESVWAADMQHPNVRCYVAWVDRAPAPLHPPGLFPPAVADVMRERFMPPFLDSGYAIYVAQDH